MSPARKAEAPGRLSTVTAAVSGLLVAGLIGYLTVHAFGPNEPPAIVAEAVPAENWTRDGTSYLAIDVRNEGDLAAADVQVQVQPDGDGVEVRRASIDYLAGGETSRIYVAVPGAGAASGSAEGPRRAPRVRVVGFKEP